MKTLTILLMLTSLTALSAHAGKESDGTRGGGDDMGYEFMEISIDNCKRLMPLAGVYTTTTYEECLKINSEMKVLVVEEEQNVESGGTIQSSIATNDFNTKDIRITRTRWANVTRPAIKIAIAFHEMLGLLQKEKTGQYQHTIQFMSLIGEKLSSDDIMRGYIDGDARICGLNGSIVERMLDCSESKKANHAVWTLVARSMNTEVWKDETSDLLWTQASNEKMTQEKAAKFCGGEMSKQLQAEITDVAWKLPSMVQYNLEAKPHGLESVVKNVSSSQLWSTTAENAKKSSYYVYNGASGSIASSASSDELNVLCVGKVQ